LATTVLTCVLTVAFLYFTVVVLNESECDNAECGFIGEFLNAPWGLSVVALASIAISFFALWPFFRRRLPGAENAEGDAQADS
jgi:hypothetical protein